jgi:hypothetical protein
MNGPSSSSQDAVRQGDNFVFMLLVLEVQQGS